MEEFMDTDKTAIFVDGAFFIKRAKSIFGSIEPEKLADKLWSFSLRHIYPYHNRKIDDLSKKEKDLRETSDFHYALDHLSWMRRIVIGQLFLKK